MKVLVIGKDGQLGSELVRLFPGAIGTSRKDPAGTYLNLKDPGMIVRTISEYNPDVVINTAAQTNVDRCEEDKLDAYSVNAIAIKNMAKACSKTGSYFIHVSTDYVFDGRKGNYAEEDVPNPINYYGISKIIGEAYALSYDNSLVIRTSGVYGVKMNFPLFVVKTLREGGTVNCIDSYYSPVHATMLAKAIREVIVKSPHGILNISGRRMSRYEFALKIKNILKIDTGMISLSGSVPNMKASRPYDSSLNNEMAHSFLYTQFDDLNKSIEYLGKVKQDAV